MQRLSISAVSKRFGAVSALRDVSLEVAPGEFCCVVGPSNAGKTTLLKTIAGLHRVDAGKMRIDDVDITNLLPNERNVSLLFQNMALFPTLSGFENIAFPLRTAGMSLTDIRERVQGVARMLKVSHILERRPATFSGGEQQRVAIGRALVRPGRLLMLDEPLTNLDARMRIELRIQFKKLHAELGQAIVYVTHDQVEAMSLSDKVAVLDHGSIQQVGTPDDVYHRPRSRFVAEFIGSPPMNMIRVIVGRSGSSMNAVARGLNVRLSGVQEKLLTQCAPRSGVVLGVRPEEIEVGCSEAPQTPTPADVLWVEKLGNKSILTLRVGEASLKATVAPTHEAQGQSQVWIGIPAESVHLLDEDTGLFLRGTDRENSASTH